MNWNSMDLVAYLLNLALVTTAVCLITWLTARTAFKHNPAARYHLSLSAIFCLLACPFAAGWLTAHRTGLVSIPLTTPSTQAAATAPPLADVIDSAAIAMAPLNAEKTPHSKIGGAELLGTVWFMGLLLATARLASGVASARNLRTNATEWIGALPNELLEEAGVKPKVLVSSQIRLPIAIGLSSPSIVLPKELVETLTSGQMRQILLHEYAHIKYKHVVGGLFERGVRTLLWPQPFVQLVCAELDRAREEICDNFASADCGATSYAKTLLLVAERISFGNGSVRPVLGLGMAGTDLEKRIAGLLNPRRNQMVRLRTWQIGAVSAIAIIGMGSLGLVRFAGAAELPSYIGLPHILSPIEPDDRELAASAELESAVRRAQEIPGSLEAKRKAEKQAASARKSQTRSRKMGEAVSVRAQREKLAAERMELQAQRKMLEAQAHKLREQQVELGRQAQKLQDEAAQMKSQRMTVVQYMSAEDQKRLSEMLKAQIRKGDQNAKQLNEAQAKMFRDLAARSADLALAQRAEVLRLQSAQEREIVKLLAERAKMQAGAQKDRNRELQERVEQLGRMRSKMDAEAAERRERAHQLAREAEKKAKSDKDGG